VDCDDGFLSLLGYDGEFDLALQDIENHIRGTALRENGLTLSAFDEDVTAAFRIEIDFRIEAALSAGLGLKSNGSLASSHRRLLRGGAGSPEPARSNRLHLLPLPH
jgi:hypothetical protein